jgi:hypothetical protein
MDTTVAIVHQPIIVDGVHYQPGDKLFGDLAERELANEVHRNFLTRAPLGVHEIPDEVRAADPAPAPAPVERPTPSAFAPSSTTSSTSGD